MPDLNSRALFNKAADLFGLTSTKAKMTAAAALVASLPIAGMAGWEYGTVDVDQCHITNAGTKRYGDRDVYLVYTSDCGVFKNVDDAWWLKFRSSDVQGEAMKTGFFEIKSNGWRLPLASAYPNILKLTPL